MPAKYAQPTPPRPQKWDDWFHKGNLYRMIQGKLSDPTLNNQKGKYLLGSDPIIRDKYGGNVSWIRFHFNEFTYRGNYNVISPSKFTSGTSLECIMFIFFIFNRLF